MSTIILPGFSAIDSDALDEYYDSDIDLNGTTINIDLNFDNKCIDIKRLEIVKHFIENIRIHDLNNKKYFQQDMDNASEDKVRTYLEHHLEQLAEDELEDLIGANKKTADQPGLLLKKLQLVRVGLYPDSEAQFAIFDYSIGRELTDYLIVVNTDENGNLDYLTMES